MKYAAKEAGVRGRHGHMPIGRKKRDARFEIRKVE